VMARYFELKAEPAEELQQAKLDGGEDAGR
jgi:hypothetical protein